MKVSNASDPKRFKFRGSGHRKPGEGRLTNLLGYAVRAFQRGRRYSISIWWMFKHGLLRRRGSFWWLVVLSAASLGAQALAIGVIFQYVNLIEKGGPIPVLNVTLDWLQSYNGLLVLVALVAVLLTLNHLTLYHVRMMAISWAGDTEKYCGRLALSLAKRLPDLSRLSPTATATDSELRKLVTVNARYCGLTVRIMAMSLPTVIALIGSVLFLFVVEWKITCVIVALGLVIFLFQYPANLKGAAATRRWQALRPDAIQQTLAAIECLRLGTHRLGGTSQLRGDLYDQLAVNGAIDAYSNRLQAIEAGTFVTQIGTTLLIAAVILVLGDRVLTGDGGWAAMVTYITLLRVASGNFSGLARTTTSMARLYPQVQDFVTFVHKMAQPDQLKHLKSPAWALRIKISKNSKGKGKGGKSSSDITIERSTLIAVVTQDTRLAARPDFAVTLAAKVCASQLTESVASATEATGGSANLETGDGTSGVVTLVANGRIQSESVPRNMLGLPTELSPKEWRAPLDEMRHVRSDLGKYIDACSKVDLDQQLGQMVEIDRVGLIAQIATALVRRASVVILEHDALEALDCRSVEDPLIRLLQRDCLVMIWYQRDHILRGGSPDFGEQTALVCDGTEVKASFDLGKPGANESLKLSLSVRLDSAGKELVSSDQGLDEALLEEE